MRHLAPALSVLFLLSLIACAPPETVVVSAAPTAAPTTATLTPTPTATRTAAPTTAAPTTPAPTRTAPPGGTPSPACPTFTGGSPLATSRLVAIRAAHNPGFDRVVFEWTGNVVPEHRVDLASSFIATSGQAVRVDGNAFFSVRMVGQAHTDAGVKSYPQPDPFRVGLSVVREIKVVEDFEGVVRFGLGMERAVCPNVSTLLSPARIVIDFPAAP